MRADEQLSGRRPAGVTWLAVGVLIIGGGGWVRAWLAVRQYAFLEGLLPVSPAYLVVSGMLVGIAGLGVAGSLWWGWRRARPAARGFALVFSLYYWLDRLALVGDAPGVNWPFAAGLNLALLAWTFWVLTRSGAKTYFGESDEQ